MTKFNYKVIKGFTLIQDEEGYHVSDESGPRNQGTTFRKKSRYVDYEFPEEDIEETEITKTLLDKGYIELVSEKKTKD